MLNAPYKQFRIPQWCYEVPERPEDDDWDAADKQPVYTFKGRPERGAAYMHDYKPAFRCRGREVLQSSMMYYIVYIQEEDRTFFGFTTQKAVKDFINGHFTGRLFCERYSFRDLGKEG